MASVLESLKSVNAYPVPTGAIEAIAARRGVSLNEEATPQALNGSEYNLALADVLLWLSDAPNIAQGGQNYSFSDTQRSQFITRANRIYKKYDEESVVGNKPTFGYKGSEL